MQVCFFIRAYRFAFRTSRLFHATLAIMTIGTFLHEFDKKLN